MQKIKSLNNFEAEDIDLRKLIKTIYRGKRNFIAITSLTFILSIFYAFSLTPKWRGQFDIVLENNEKGSTGQIGNPLEILNINKLSVQQTLNTEVAILKSPSVLNPIYEFVKKEKNSSDIEKFKQPYSVWFKNNFKVELIQGTTVLKVIYEDEKKDIILLQVCQDLQ